MNSSESEYSEDGIGNPNLPSKSKKLYRAAYNAFKKWRKGNKSNSFCEDVLLAYFEHLSQKYAPPSLWATFSMLKCTISTYDNIDIGRYDKLIAFLKKYGLGYRPKKSSVFTRDNISTFLSEAPNDVYLCHKVALIFGICGALRRDEFVNITVGDVKKVEDDVLLVKVPKTKNYVSRYFTIVNELFHFCWKYIQTRPKNCSVDRFFLRYMKGACISQVIGVNKFGSMPKAIAEYLNLPDAHNFTGHSFRRTSATLLVDAGGDITTMQRHGGCKSATFAFVNIADSTKNKKRICEQITDGMEITKRTRTVIAGTLPEHEPSPTGVNVCKSASNEDSGASTSNVALSQSGKKEVVSSDSDTTDVLKDCTSIRSSIPSTSNVDQSEKPKGAYFNHQDIGLDFQKFTNEDVSRPNYMFNNCNITINGLSGNLTFNNCNVKLTCATQDINGQTEERG